MGVTQIKTEDCEEAKRLLTQSLSLLKERKGFQVSQNLKKAYNILLNAKEIGK